MIALLDCNNFYVSCERLFNTKLVNKAVVVLSNNDGCIISRSEEAKNMGIRMGEPFFKIEKKLIKLGVYVYSSNYPLYADISKRVMSIIQKSCPILEEYSIDEVFFDLTFIKNKEIEKFCFELRSKILKWTGIPVSIGIGKTKTLAKVANRVVKKESEYKVNFNFNGVYKIISDNQLDFILKNTKVENIWGIGRRLSIFFDSINIDDALKLKNVNLKFAKQKKGILTQKTILELRGVKCFEIELEKLKKKSICVSRSFGEKVFLYKDLQSALIVYSEKASEKLRKYKLYCEEITVFLQTSRYEKIYYTNSKSSTFIQQTSDSRKIWIKANYLLSKIYINNLRYNKVGIILSRLCEKKHIQVSLFKNTLIDEKNKSEENLMKIFDDINKRFGEGKIRISSNTHSFFYRNKVNYYKKNSNWLMKSSFSSPCYTTQWCDIPKVNIG